MSAHGEVSQKSMLKCENVGNVSRPMFFWIKFLEIVQIDYLLLGCGGLVAWMVRACLSWRGWCCQMGVWFWGL